MDRIGEYLVKRLIGEGGMGKVYEAEERLSGRRVALKVMRSELMRSEEGRKMFLSEMQILAHLEHPSLVRSLASMEVDGQLVLVLEYLRGRTLRQELGRAGAIPWSEACDYVVRIADALSVAHEQTPTIVHRDLKPENVMLVVKEGEDENGPAQGLKVMDFGVAKVLEAANATNTQSIGTLAYMSPEQIDARSIDARSDLYALGLMFYEMIAGVPPFRSTSPRELLNLQCTATPPPLDADVRRGLPRGVEELLFSLLEKDPEKRPGSARVVSERLSPFCSAGALLGTTAPRAVTAPASPQRTDPLVKTEPSKASSQNDSKSGGKSGSDTAGETATKKTEDAPRNDTVALLEKKTGAKELPGWLAISAIVALSLAAFLSTYLVRTKLASSQAPRDVVTTSASTR